jgi:hypothetical protein
VSGFREAPRRRIGRPMPTFEEVQEMRAVITELTVLISEVRTAYLKSSRQFDWIEWEEKARIAVLRVNNLRHPPPKG